MKTQEVQKSMPNLSKKISEGHMAHPCENCEKDNGKHENHSYRTKTRGQKFDWQLVDQMVQHIEDYMMSIVSKRFDKFN